MRNLFKIQSFVIILLGLILSFNQTMYALDNPFQRKETSQPKINTDWYQYNKDFYFSEDRLNAIRDDSTYGCSLKPLDTTLHTLCNISKQESITKRAEYIAELFQGIPKDKAKKIIEDNQDFFNSYNWNIIDDTIVIKDTNTGECTYYAVIQQKEDRLLQVLKVEINKSGIMNLEFI